MDSQHEHPLCDPPQLDQHYVQHDYSAPTALGDIRATIQGLSQEHVAASGDWASGSYMMSPFVEAGHAVKAYEPMWQQLRYDNTSMNITQQMRNYKWLLFEAQITKKKNADKQDTHKALNNGKFCIPFVADAKQPRVAEDAFLTYYAHARLLGHRQFFVETRTPVFRFYMDLDFKQPSPLTPRNMEGAAKVICLAIKRFWPQKNPDDSFFRCIVSTTNYKTVKGVHGDADAIIKSGVHLIWPDIYLTDDMALDMRETVIAELMEKFGHRAEPAMNPWNDVVDLSVYKGSGLRMIGSCKTEPCVACKRKGVDDSGATCTDCGGNRTVDSGRPYMPLLVLNGLGERDRAEEAVYLKNFRKVVQDTKIRCALQEPPASGFQVPEGAPRYSDDKKRGGGNANTHGLRGADARTFKRRLDVTSPEAADIQSFIRTSIGGGVSYNQILVQSVLASGKDTNKHTRFIVNVLGFNATYCQNVGRCHRSNRAYFEISAEGCVQRCHDQSESLENDMKFGLCKDYKSAHVRLPRQLVAVLFPDVAAKQDAMEMLTQEAADEDDGLLRDTELNMRHDLKMRSLLGHCDKLSQDLHGCEYASTLQLPSLGASRKRLRMIRIDNGEKHSKQALAAAALGGKGSLFSIPMYAEIDPSALGLRADEGLRTLGFCASSDRLEQEPKRAAKSELSDVDPPSSAASRMIMDKLEMTLMSQLHAILELSWDLCVEDVLRYLEPGRYDGFEGLLTAKAKQPNSRQPVRNVQLHSIAMPAKQPRSSKLRFEK